MSSTRRVFGSSRRIRRYVSRAEELSGKAHQGLLVEEVGALKPGQRLAIRGESLPVLPLRFPRIANPEPAERSQGAPRALGERQRVGAPRRLVGFCLIAKVPQIDRKSVV